MNLPLSLSMPPFDLRDNEKKKNLTRIKFAKTMIFKLKILFLVLHQKGGGCINHFFLFPNKLVLV